MTRLTVLGIVAALLLLAPSAAWSKGDPRLVGRWYGEGPQPYSRHAQWIIEYRADETFRIVFRLFHDSVCEHSEMQEESGVWQLDPRRLVLITTRVQGAATDTNSAEFRDTYRIVRLDAHGYQMVHERYGVTYTNRRVGQRFSFPVEDALLKLDVGPLLSFEWRTRGDGV